MQDAVEMAVLSSVQHPNIVQLYACLTNMAEVAGARAEPAAPRAPPRLPGGAGS